MRDGITIEMDEFVVSAVLITILVCAVGWMYVQSHVPAPTVQVQPCAPQEPPTIIVNETVNVPPPTIVQVPSAPDQDVDQDEPEAKDPPVPQNRALVIPDSLRHPMSEMARN
jgi:hypothetical protein